MFNWSYLHHVRAVNTRSSQHNWQLTMCIKKLTLLFHISRSHFQYFTIAMRMRINSKDFVVGIFNRCILYDTKGSIFYGYGRKQLYCWQLGKEAGVPFHFPTWSHGEQWCSYPYYSHLDFVANQRNSKLQLKLCWLRWMMMFKVFSRYQLL